MRKYSNKASGKSDKHQLAMLKAASSHVPDALEKWYTRITTPKARNYNLHGRPVAKVKPAPKPRKQADPQKTLDKRLKDRIRLARYKRNTHWVARSQSEYDTMHQF